VSQKKIVKKKTIEDSVGFFRQFNSAIQMAKSCEHCQYEPDLRKRVVEFLRGTEGKGCLESPQGPLARMAFEKVLFPYSEDKIFGGQTFMAFLENGCRELFPNAIKSHIEDKDFI
jgi:hypothetical protein